MNSIEVGKQAEFIVLDHNLFEIDPHGTNDTKVELRMINGVIRHRDGI